MSTTAITDGAKNFPHKLAEEVEANRADLESRVANLETGEGTPAFRARGVVTANVADLSAFTVAGNDGITYVAGDVVFLANQTTAKQSGPYVVGTVGTGTAPLTRPSWWAAASTIPVGQIIEIGPEGTKWGASSWKTEAAKNKVVDTDDPNFYPRVVQGTQALTAGSATVSSLFISSKALAPQATDQTGANAVQVVPTVGHGDGSLALTGTGTDTIGYLVLNF